MARATPGGFLCDCGPIANRVGGSRWPSPDEVAQRVRRALTRLRPLPDWITLSGNDDPTLHPRFGVVVDRVLAARDALAPAARVAVLTNGLRAGQPSLRHALQRVDAVQLHSGLRLTGDTTVQEVPRERLEEMARALRDALPDVIVEVY